MSDDEEIALRSARRRSKRKALRVPVDKVPRRSAVHAAAEVEVEVEVDAPGSPDAPASPDPPRESAGHRGGSAPPKTILDVVPSKTGDPVMGPVFDVSMATDGMSPMFAMPDTGFLDSSVGAPPDREGASDAFEDGTPLRPEATQIAPFRGGRIAHDTEADASGEAEGERPSPTPPEAAAAEWSPANPSPVRGASGPSSAVHPASEARSASATVSERLSSDDSLPSPQPEALPRERVSPLPPPASAGVEATSQPALPDAAPADAASSDVGQHSAPHATSDAASDAPSEPAAETTGSEVQDSEMQDPLRSSMLPASPDATVVVRPTMQVSEPPPPLQEPEEKPDDAFLSDESTAPGVTLEELDAEELGEREIAELEAKDREAQGQVTDAWREQFETAETDEGPELVEELEVDDELHEVPTGHDFELEMEPASSDDEGTLQSGEQDSLLLDGGELEELEPSGTEELDLEEVQEAGDALPLPPPAPTPGDPNEPDTARAPELESRPLESIPATKRPRRRPWFEVFFSDDYLRTVRPPTPKEIARECDFIERALRLNKGATILDVGCGLGLQAIELTQRGYLVVGLDLSLPMLSRAADDAQDQGLKINFLHADMREMNFEGAFDAILCWGTTFGYFDDETNKRVISQLHRALKPRGVLLLDVVNRDHVIGQQPNLIWFEGDGCVCMEESRFNYFTSRLEVKRTVILDDGRQRENTYGIRLYALHELGQLLHHQGFRVTEVSGMKATPGVFFGADSPSMIIRAERRADGPRRGDEGGRGAESEY